MTHNRKMDFCDFLIVFWILCSLYMLFYLLVQGKLQNINSYDL